MALSFLVYGNGDEFLNRCCIFRYQSGSMALCRKGNNFGATFFSLPASLPACSPARPPQLAFVFSKCERVIKVISAERGNG